jgi:hypothetical protein
VVPDLLEFAGRPRTNAEFEAWLAERFGPLPKPGAWWALRAYAPRYDHWWARLPAGDTRLLTGLGCPPAGRR